ncbi:hypothetical protein D9C73_016473 [Collichthys lucidus]|uniref:Uncharacterized protein n=1 Tax=Collichthys lucidus TaxID=240159 RepID=A0A4U5V3H1_COLLU|nr:hypothetical protein D9C73_016473 [Collichthys lucidus]
MRSSVYFLMAHSANMLQRGGEGEAAEAPAVTVISGPHSRRSESAEANPEVSDFIRSRPAGGDITRFDK